MSIPTPLEFLTAVYCNEGLPLPVRMKAAIEAAAYVHPKLAVIGVANGQDFATLLDERIKRHREAKVIEGKAIEATPLPPTGPEPTPAGAPFSRLRRI